MSDNSSGQQSGFEQNLINKVAMEAVAEQRRARRWGIFFKSLFALYLLAFLLIYLLPDIGSQSIMTTKHTALIDIDGVISASTEANADNIVTSLRSAYKDKKTAGIILRINSPGGSPVQAGYINDEIVRLRTKHPDIPLYAVISDICASGGYYIAAAADKIYADKASVVGSIGVVMSGFGFVETIDKLGIERRLLHAGEHKGFLDPFSPLKQEEVDHIDTVLEDVYQQFIDVVKKGRGDRLKDDEQIFSGLVWTGEESLQLGLVDALGSSSYVAREIIGAEEIVDFTRRMTLIEELADSFGTAMAKTLSSRFELR